MGIIGIVLASITFLCLCAFIDTNPSAAAGWGVISTLYLLAYSIVGTCTKSKRIGVPQPPYVS
jgi:hypothetical protein